MWIPYLIRVLDSDECVVQHSIPGKNDTGADSSCTAWMDHRSLYLVEGQVPDGGMDTSCPFRI